MRIGLGLAAAMFAAMLSGHALAETATQQSSGERLAEGCRAYKKMVQAGNKFKDVKEAYNAGRCVGDVETVLDRDLYAGPSTITPKFCIPGDATLNAMVEAVANYLDAHSELRSQEAYSLIHKALADAWPCHQ